MAERKKRGGKAAEPPPLPTRESRRLSHLTNRELFTIVLQYNKKTIAVDFIRAAGRALISRPDVRAFLTPFLTGKDTGARKVAEKLLEQIPSEEPRSTLPVVVVDTVDAKEEMENIALLRIMVTATNPTDVRKRAWEILKTRHDLQAFLKGPLPEKALVRSARLLLERLRMDDLEGTLPNTELVTLFYLFGETGRSMGERKIIVAEFMRRKGAANILLARLRERTTREESADLLRFIVRVFQFVPEPILRHWLLDKDDEQERLLDTILLDEELQPIVKRRTDEFLEKGKKKGPR